MPAGVTADQKAFYVALIQKIRATPEWLDFMEKGAFNQTYMVGAEFEKWLTSAEVIHQGLMQEAGFMAKK
jgi:tripartite-type tricarboxylate transporter receptor subunit TctC